MEQCAYQSVAFLEIPSTEVELEVYIATQLLDNRGLVLCIAICPAYPQMDAWRENVRNVEIIVLHKGHTG